MSLILIALSFNGLDLITGLLSAVKNKNLNSSKLRDGLFKKVGFVLCYVLSMMVDRFGGQVGFDVGVRFTTVIVSYTVLTEITSIIENICKINTDLLPDKLKELFDLEVKK